MARRRCRFYRAHRAAIIELRRDWVLHAKMVSRVAPTNTSSPAPPAPDSGLTTQNQLLAEQNNLLGQMTTLLTQLVQNTATSATPATPVAAAPANVTAATPVAAPVNFYGQETLTHVTREHIQAILVKTSCTALAVAAAWGTIDDDSADRLVLQGAARMVTREVAELIYSIPENQNWYPRRVHPTAVMVHTKDYGWASRRLEEVVDDILKTIVHLLMTNLTTEDKGGQYEDIIMCIEDSSEGVQSAVAWFVKHQSWAAAGNAPQPVVTSGTS